MDRKKIGAVLFGASLTLASASGFAFNARSQSTYGYPQSQQSTKSQDHALRAAIKAKRTEVKQLQKAGDPRAAQAARELDALNAQWRATRGNGKGNGRWTHGSSGTTYPNGTMQNGRRGDDDEDQSDSNRGRQNEEHGKQGKGHGQGHGQGSDD